MNILVAEDEPGIRRSLIKMLATLGYGDIREARDGLEAIQLIRQAYPQVILADIRMPGMNGLELLTRATLLSDKIKCIFISGFDSFEYAQKAIDLGASGYLLKPVKESDLRAALEKVKRKFMNNPDGSKAGGAQGTLKDGNIAAPADNDANNLLPFLQKGDRSSAEVYIDEQFASLKKAGSMEGKQLLKLNFRFVQQIFKAISQLGINGEELIGDQFQMLRRLNKCPDTDSTAKMMKDILSICFDETAASGKRVINKQIELAKGYISQNYAKDITEMDVAQYVHLNMSYFSRLFKQESSEKFVDYLCNYRLNKAIELLNEGIFKANEVSHMVGFSNEKYFYKIFKKKTGFTPSEIRNI